MKRDGRNGRGAGLAARRSIPSFLGEASLTMSEVAGFESEPTPIMPDVRVIKIGGQSVTDRGRRALMPLVDEIAALKDRYHLLVCAGGGTRARHAYDLALDLELPTGVLAALGGFVPRQNARILQMLLAKHGGIFILHDDFEKLPLYFRLGCIPVMTGMPPFAYWEKPGATGRIPPNRTDAGVFLSAEFLGARRAIFVKDERGLFTADPKKDPTAEFIPRIGVADLIRRNFDDLVVERVVLEYLKNARYTKEIQIVNGLEPGQLTAAVEGEDVGTIIHA
jgi:molybdenum storage protein